MAGNASIPEVAHFDIADADEKTVAQKVAPGRLVPSTTDPSRSAGIVRHLAARAANALSVPSWLQARLGLQAPDAFRGLGPVAWHPHRDQLAAADAVDRVHICSTSSCGAQQALPSRMALHHELQQQAAALAWRPNCGQVLAVGCKAGVALWSLGRCPAGGAPAIRASVTGSPAAFWLTFLPTRGHGAVTTLAWSPDGQFLAAASLDAPGFVVFDISLGTGTPLQAGLGLVTVLSWSPDGAYLLTGGTGASFRVWQTQKWTSVAWETQDTERPLASAAWSVDSRSVVVAVRGDRQLAALYFTQPPPSLEAQLFPVPVPALPVPGAAEESVAAVVAFAWDAHGERLALAFRDAEGGPACIAVFATTQRPILTLRLLGIAAEPQLALEGGESQSDSQAERAKQSGSGGNFDGDSNVVLAFHTGGLLAVRKSKEHVSVYACS